MRVISVSQPNDNSSHFLFVCNPCEIGRSGRPNASGNRAYTAERAGVFFLLGIFLSGVSLNSRISQLSRKAINSVGGVGRFSLLNFRRVEC